MVSPEEVQDLMDKISDSQADITMVADVLAHDNSVLENCDESGEYCFIRSVSKNSSELEKELDELLINEENGDISKLLLQCKVNSDDPKDSGNSNSNCPTDILS